MPPISVLIKPASGSCNMRCSYCFYADEMENRSVQNMGIMNQYTLYAMLQRIFAYAEESCNIAFQGGEPTLAGLVYFEQAVRYAETLNVNNCAIHYALQTNGYSLGEEWIQFFKKHNFLIGISLDGIQEVHDQYRVDAKGEGTYERVMQTIQLLQQYEVEFNILTVVNGATVQRVNQNYNFYKRNDFLYQQYIECLDPMGKPPGQEAYSLTPEQYGAYLIALFKKYYKDMSSGTYVYVRYFENILGILSGHMPESCAMAGRCGTYLCIEADGSVYPCDFYVLDEWKLGNVAEHSIEQINQKRDELRFVEYSHVVPDQCEKCKWYPLCRNGCRRNCEPTSLNERQVNYYCESYRQFFEYAYPYLEQLIQYYR